jgi:hypothetical protein
LLCAGLAEKFRRGTVPRLVSTVVLQSALKPYTMQAVPHQKLCATAQAREGHEGLRLCDIVHIGHRHKGRLGYPLRINVLPVPQQGHQDLALLRLLQNVPDRLLYE